MILVALRMSVATLLLTAFVYPLAVTGLAQLLFPRQADGSLLMAHGRAVGSELIGQRFTSPRYFQGRASAAGADVYDTAASSGSNLGPTSAKLAERVAADVQRLGAENPSAGGPVPDELVTASASGLDPHLGPGAALWQVPRIAAARGVPAADLEALIAARTEPRTLGILGEPRVDVLLLNLDHEARSAGSGAR